MMRSGSSLRGLSLVRMTRSLSEPAASPIGGGGGVGVINHHQKGLAFVDPLKAAGNEFEVANAFFNFRHGDFEGQRGAYSGENVVDIDAAHQRGTDFDRAGWRLGREFQAVKAEREFLGGQICG